MFFSEGVGGPKLLENTSSNFIEYEPMATLGYTLYFPCVYFHIVCCSKVWLEPAGCLPRPNMSTDVVC